MVATEAEDNDLMIPTIIEWVTFETGVINYMVVHHALLPPKIQPPSHTPPPQGVTLTPGEYEEFLHLTHAAKSASIASIAQTGNASAYLTLS